MEVSAGLGGADENEGSVSPADDPFAQIGLVRGLIEIRNHSL